VSSSTDILSAATPPRAVPTLRTLLGLAWPIVISRATQVVIGVSDAVMVAGLGKAALAATTTGALNAFSLLILPMGIVFIVSTFSSQLFARGDLAGARRYGFYGLAVALATQVLCIAGLTQRGRVLGLFPYDPEVRRLIGDYLLYRLASGGAAIGMEALANYYGGLGKTRVPMIASVAAMALNVLANWVLIGGHWGAPALGVKGAALANSICTTLAFLGLLAKFLRDGRAARAVLPRLHLHELWRMLRFGLPSGLNWFFEFFAFLVFINVVVAGLGTTSLAAMMAVFQINSLSFMPAFGLASAGAILVGQAIGAGAKQEVPRVVRLTFLTAGTWQGLVGLLYLAIPGLLFAVFTSGPGDDGTLRTAGMRMLMFSAAWQLFDAAASTLAEALRAAGDTAFTLWGRVVLAWLVFTPGAYFTVRRWGWGEGGAVFWLVVYMALLAAVLWLRFRSGAWRHIRLTEHPPEA
jgi:MATE family multidrug resistance protein